MRGKAGQQATASVTGVSSRGQKEGLPAQGPVTIPKRLDVESEPASPDSRESATV